MTRHWQRPELSISSKNVAELLRCVHAKGALFRFKAKGASMSPFIRNGDVITVSPFPSSQLLPGDIAAFTNCNRLVVHRIVSMQNGALLTKGDNLPQADGFISRADVLGCVYKIERRGRDVRIGLGIERKLIAYLSRTGILSRLLAPLRGFCKLFRRDAFLGTADLR